jgi:Protein of unknown function (DUF3035)
MKSIAILAIGSAFCLGLSACSETGLLDKIGLGKSAPDETQVVTHNALAMPPDLQLRQPAKGVTDENQVPPVATATAVPATPPDAYSAASASAGQPAEVASTQPSAYDTGAQQLETTPGSGPAPTQILPTVQSTQKTDLFGKDVQEDAYRKFGISKTKPDGTPKTQAELERELLEAVRAEKRKQNPNYGTVFNMGRIFKD